MVWAIAASLPPLLGRNPWPLAVTLLAVVGVRVAWSGSMRQIVSWVALVRLAVVFALVGVLFNVLTVRAGDIVLAELPGWMPLIGGEVTANAVVYGVLSGMALVTLVLIGTTLGALLDWSAVVRMLPPGLTTVAVGGSIAFAVLPQTAAAFRDIREAQMARGHRFRGARDLLPVVVPMLAGGLERAMTLAESLEARGFGAPARTGDVRPMWPSVGGAAGLALAATAAYLVAVGRPLWALAVAALAAMLAAPAVVRARRGTVPRTRYRPLVWTRRDWFVLASAAVAAAATLGVARADRAALAYEPYPSLTAPAASLPLLIGLLALLAPALVAPPPAGEERA